MAATAAGLTPWGKVAKALKAGKAAIDAARGVKAAEDAVDAVNAAAHQRYVAELRAAMEKPHVSDQKLGGLMNELYRPGANVGSGSTAAAVREELRTGQPVKGFWHSQKAENTIVSLERWLRNNPQATPGDRAAAENVILDMRAALRGE